MKIIKQATVYRLHVSVSSVYLKLASTCGNASQRTDDSLQDESVLVIQLILY